MSDGNLKFILLGKRELDLSLEEAFTLRKMLNDVFCTRCTKEVHIMNETTVIEFFAHLRAKAEAEGHFIDSEVMGFLSKSEADFRGVFEEKSAPVHATNPAETAKD